MPNNDGIELLTRKETLTDEEWLALLEARRKLIKPYLKTFTLSTLGKLECLRSELSFTHDLQMDFPEIKAEDGLSLETQGTFRAQPYQYVERIPNSGFQPPPGGCKCEGGIMYIWGLARSGEWILARVEFRGEAGYKGRGYERALTVEIKKTEIEEVIENTKAKPTDILDQLSREVSAWRESRQRILEAAKQLERAISFEDFLISCIRKSPEDQE